MIIFYRNGERRVITGWREWLVWLAAAAVIVVVGGLALGIALTLFSFLLLAIPVAFVLAFIAWLVQPKP